MDSAVLSSTEDLSSSDDSEGDISLEVPSRRFTRITEDQTTENYVKTFDGFFNEMMGKVRSLKGSPALNQSTAVEIDDQQLFKHLKDTPEVKEKLDYIKGLDEEIKNVIDLYNLEKAERMQTQLELCEDMQGDQGVPDKATASFLNLCNVAMSEVGDEAGEEERVPKKPAPAGSGQFVKKNIELAKEGFMANISLTDEEKAKIEDLLREEASEECGSAASDCNAYFLTVDEKSRMKDIDSELEKFAMDEKLNEKNQCNGDYDNMTDFLLEQSIKRLESKLTQLHDKEEEDTRIPCVDTEVDKQSVDVEVDKQSVDIEVDEQSVDILE